MDEMTLLREFRDSAPAAAPPRCARVPSGAAARPSRPLRYAALRPAPRPPSSPHGFVVAAVVDRVTSAAAVLDRAALALADAADSPGAGVRTQWFYHARPVSATPSPVRPGTHPGRDLVPVRRRSGRRPRARRRRARPGHRVLAPGHARSSGTTSLAGAPRAARRTCSPTCARTRCTPPRGATQADRDFDEVTQALTAETFVPPADRARLYLALATIPGVGVDEKAAPDLVGRPVLSITFTGDTLARPRRRPLGAAARPGDVRRPGPPRHGRLGHRPGRRDDRHTPGTVWYEMAILDHRIVDQAGATRLGRPRRPRPPASRAARCGRSAWPRSSADQARSASASSRFG